MPGEEFFEIKVTYDIVAWGNVLSRLGHRLMGERPGRKPIGSQQIRRRAVVRPFSNFSRTGDKNSADRRTIRHPVRAPALIVCTSQTVVRQRSEHVTNHAERRTAFHVEISMDTHLDTLLSKIPTARPRRLPRPARRRPPRPFPRPGRPRQTRSPRRPPCGRWHCHAASPEQSPGAPPLPGICPAGRRGRQGPTARVSRERRLLV